MCQCYNNFQLNSMLCQLWWNPFQILYVHAKTSLNSFNSCSTSSTLPISNCALLFTVGGFASVPISLINIHPTIWLLLELHPLQGSIVHDCNMFPDTPYFPELLMAHICCRFLFFVFCTPNSYYEILVHICNHDLHICGFHILNYL